MMRALILSSLLLACSLDPVDFEAFLTTTGTSGESSGAPEPKQDIAWSIPEEVEILDLPPLQGCRELDILFVVDNSGSMAEEQDKLQLAAPSLLELLEDFDIGFDLHIGVTTTDRSYDYNPPECDGIGALIRQTPEGVCLVDRGYLTRADDLEALFPCLFLVGIGGATSGTEKPFDAVVGAIKPSVSEVGPEAWPGSYRDDDCNLGFFRPEAGLVVVILTDEDDHSDCTPTETALKMWQLQNGPIAIVLFGPKGCLTGETPLLDEFAMLLPTHVAPVCSDDYGAELAEATETIRASCYYEPQG